MQKTLDKLRNGEHVTIVAFGDSNTAETFHTRGHMGWVSLLAEAIFSAYGTGVCTLINSGVCGSSFGDALERVERDVSRFRPDLVIVAFGVWGGHHGMEKIEDFKEGLRQLIHSIRESCNPEILVRTPNPVVAVHGLPLPEGQQSGRPLTTHPFREYAAAQVEVARELGCDVIDHYTLWEQAKFPCARPVSDPQGLWPRMSDATHPGALGHLAFFRELAPLFGVATYFPWEHIEPAAALESEARTGLKY